MVSFRQKNSEQKKSISPRNYLARHEQHRLLILVLVLGAVVIAASEARRPERWQWLWNLDGQDETVELKVEKPPETRLPEQDQSQDDLPGTFISKPPERQVAKTGRYFPGVVPEYLNEVQDNTIFRSVERDAWFHLFEILKKTDEATLEKESTGRVSFVQLFGQSKEYRGELVTVVGIVRRVYRLTAPKNYYGIDKYCQVWITPTDNPNSVMVLYVLQLPDGFPTGVDLAESVTVVGFYFKRWVYNAQDDIRTVPVLLARTVQWKKKAPPPIEAPISLLSIVFVGVAAILFAVVFTAIVIRTKKDSH